jgi:hypothetical protein
LTKQAITFAFYSLLKCEGAVNLDICSHSCPKVVKVELEKSLLRREVAEKMSESHKEEEHDIYDP